MTASASKTVARASVTRFIGNLPCNHCERRKESTDRREYSWRGKLCQGTDEAPAADGIVQPFPLSSTAEPAATSRKSSSSYHWGRNPKVPSKRLADEDQRCGLTRHGR